MTQFIQNFCWFRQITNFINSIKAVANINESRGFTKIDFQIDFVLWELTRKTHISRLAVENRFSKNCVIGSSLLHIYERFRNSETQSNLLNKRVCSRYKQKQRVFLRLKHKKSVEGPIEQIKRCITRSLPH